MMKIRKISASVEDEISEIEQEFSSADTAINGPQGKLPAIFKLITIPNGSLVLDYGGGKPEAEAIAQAYLDQFDATELIYDPFNQTKEHNQDVVKQCRENGGADVAVCSNVLNVIKEPEVRLNVLQNIKKLTKPNGSVYITVYEGSGSGEGLATQKNKSYQNNRKTAGYLEEVQQVFPNAKRKGKLIHATNSDSVESIVSSISICTDSNIESVEDEVRAVARDYMIQEFGFTEQDVDSYLVVESKYLVEYNATKIQVRAELSYGALMDLSEILDPIVQKYDEDSYFEAVTSGIIEAFVYDDNIAAATNTCGIPAKVDITAELDPEPLIDSPEENADLIIEDGITDEIEFTLDGVEIYTKQGEDVEFVDTSWVDSVDASLTAEFGPIRDVPTDIILDDTLDVIAFEIDEPTGNYKLFGDITLVYTISGVTSEEEYNEEDQQMYTEYDTSGVYYDLDFRKSSIQNIRVEKIDK